MTLWIILRIASLNDPVLFSLLALLNVTVTLYVSGIMNVFSFLMNDCFASDIAA